MSITIRELIDRLNELAEEHGDEVEVRLAHQPRWAFEYSIQSLDSNGVELYNPADDADEDPRSSLDEFRALSASEQNDALARYETWKDENPPVVYIAEGQQLGYLPGAAANLINWGRN